MNFKTWNKTKIVEKKDISRIIGNYYYERLCINRIRKEDCLEIEAYNLCRGRWETNIFTDKYILMY